MSIPSYFPPAKQAKIEEGYPSDGELPILPLSLPLFSRNLPISPVETTLQCVDRFKQLKNIKGGTLLEIAHGRVNEIFGESLDGATEYEKDIDGTHLLPPDVRKGTLFVKSPRDWFMTFAGWKGMIPKKEVQEYFFRQFAKDEIDPKFSEVIIYDKESTFTLKSNRLHISKNFKIASFDVTKAWEKVGNQFVEVPNGRTDLSYSQILRAIQFIKTTFKLSDSDLSYLQLKLLDRDNQIPSDLWKNTPLKEKGEITIFLDYLNALMFGVEASGLNAAIISGLMTLDLINDRHLTYESAFKANLDGGIYPFATFGDNKNTFSKREELLERALSNPSMKELRENPSLSPIANKEVMLIVFWLKKKGIAINNSLYEHQVKTVDRAFKELLNAYFFFWRSLNEGRFLNVLELIRLEPE